MNRNEVENWLNKYLPIEKELKDYYLAYKQPMPEVLFFSLLVKHQGLNNTIDSNFNDVSPGYKNIGQKYTDEVWLEKYEDISIRKHPRYLPPFEHHHTFFELTYVLKGKCKQTFLNSKKENKITMTTGNLCIIAPNTTHMMEVYDDSIIINILVRKNLLRETLSTLVPKDNLLFHFLINALYTDSGTDYLLFKPEDYSRLSDIVLDMFVEISGRPMYSQKATPLFLGLLFIYIERSCIHENSVLSNIPQGMINIPNILDYIQKNYATTSTQDIANHFSLSKSYLCRLFKRHTKETITDTLQKIRVNVARNLLEKTILPVDDIAICVGYEDVTYFIRVFKKYTASTPHQYRLNASGL